MRNPATIMITGSTDGLGRALALRLAAEGHRLILHGRSAERLDRASQRVGRPRRKASVRPITVRADLSQPGRGPIAGGAGPGRRPTGWTCWSATPASAAVNRTAGSGGSARTAYELRFAVNYLAGFLLTLELLPLLKVAGTVGDGGSR